MTEPKERITVRIGGQTLILDNWIVFEREDGSYYEGKIISTDTFTNKRGNQ